MINQSSQKKTSQHIWKLLGLLPWCIHNLGFCLNPFRLKVQWIDGKGIWFRDLQSIGYPDPRGWWNGMTITVNGQTFGPMYALIDLQHWWMWQIVVLIQWHLGEFGEFKISITYIIRYVTYTNIRGFSLIWNMLLNVRPAWKQHPNRVLKCLLQT